MNNNEWQRLISIPTDFVFSFSLDADAAAAAATAIFPILFQTIWCHQQQQQSRRLSSSSQSHSSSFADSLNTQRRTTHMREWQNTTHTHTDTQWANNNKYIACEWGEKPTMCTQATRNDEETTENTQQKCLFPYVFVCFGAVTPERANSHSICFIRSTTKLDFSFVRRSMCDVRAHIRINTSFVFARAATAISGRLFRNKYDVHLDSIVRVIARFPSLSLTLKFSVVGLPCTGCFLSLCFVYVLCTAKFVVASRAHER